MSKSCAGSGTSTARGGARFQRYWSTRTCLRSATHVAWKRQGKCMATSSLDLSNHGDLRLLANLVLAIRQSKPDVRFLLVGAMARDLLTWYTHKIQAQRATEDVDFAFAVPD